jgi:hypothetical protein
MLLAVAYNHILLVSIDDIVLAFLRHLATAVEVTPVEKRNTPVQLWLLIEFLHKCNTQTRGRRVKRRGIVPIHKREPSAYDAGGNCARVQDDLSQPRSRASF